MRCRCAKIYVKLYPTPCVALLLLPKIVGAGDVIHGGQVNSNIVYLRSGGMVYIMLLVIYSYWLPLQMLAHRRCIRTRQALLYSWSITCKDNPAKLRLQSLLLQSLNYIVYFIDSNKPATLLVNPEYEATAAPPDDHS